MSTEVKIKETLLGGLPACPSHFACGGGPRNLPHLFAADLLSPEFRVGTFKRVGE